MQAKPTESIRPFEQPGLRVALVHDWLTGYRGGEKVLHVFCELFPDATLYTLFHARGSTHPDIERHRIVPSWMNRIPNVHDHYRRLLPLFPGWIDRLDLSAYDLVISTSHCVAKGARVRAGATHLCYCHTPMRYVWDRFDDYFGSYPQPLKALIGWEAKRLRSWDRRTADRPQRYLANSTFVRDRILRFYGTDPDRVEVLHPPVDLASFPENVLGRARGDGYLVVSALVPYKRIDVAVEACARTGRPLVVAGTGPEEQRLREIAEREPDARVEFRGFVPDDELGELMATHRALLFPGVEDFGITPVEAMACGLPVIARGEGGVLDTVREGVSGVLYQGAGTDALIGALDRFERDQPRFDPPTMRAHAAGFDRPRFAERAREAIERCMAQQRAQED